MSTLTVEQQSGCRAHPRSHREPSAFSHLHGDRLGSYRALTEGGPCTAGELAARTSTHERYVRMAVAKPSLASWK
jgi:hypothetical protein